MRSLLDVFLSLLQSSPTCLAHRSTSQQATSRSPKSKSTRSTRRARRGPSAGSARTRAGREGRECARVCCAVQRRERGEVQGKRVCATRAPSDPPEERVSTLDRERVARLGDERPLRVLGRARLLRLDSSRRRDPRAVRAQAPTRVVGPCWSGRGSRRARRVGRDGRGRVLEHKVVRGGGDGSRGERNVVRGVAAGGREGWDRDDVGGRRRRGARDGRVGDRDR